MNQIIRKTSNMIRSLTLASENTDLEVCFDYVIQYNLLIMLLWKFSLNSFYASVSPLIMPRRA